MTKHEYQDYQQRVATFFEREEINNLCSVDSEAEAFFSWYPCECCCRDLGGDREHASGWNPTLKQVQEYDVCTDCLYYAEYGRLNDMTMIDVERNDHDRLL